jgi:hypothetical protein
MGKALMVISYDQPEDTQDALRRLSETAETVRHLFEDQPDLQVHIAIRETADAVLDVFKG